MSRSAAPGPARPATIWHRIRPGPKLALLAVWGLAVVLLHGPAPTASFAALTLVAVLTARLPRRATLRVLAPVLVTAGLAGGYQVWARGGAVGLEVALDLVTLVLAALVVTGTTRIDALLDQVTRAARPVRRWVDPDRLALALALTVRSVPALLTTARETRDAARARGLERDPRALVVPAAVRAVGRARSTGEALAARGLGD